MILNNNWCYKPYMPLDRISECLNPYICRLAPYENSIQIQWFDNSKASEHALYYRKCGINEWNKLSIKEETLTLTDLEVSTEYELYIENDLSLKSNVRLAKTGFVPGTVVNYLHPEDLQYDFSGHYLCSPSIVRLPSGALLASNDVFAPNFPQNLTIIYRSDDNGKTWRYLTELFPCFWGKMFVHKQKLYMLSVSNEYGDLLIGCSEDEGYTWAMPTVIARGSCSPCENGLHKAPCVVLESHGRLWTAVDYGSHTKKSFSNALFSIDVNDDLMQAENWSSTGFLHHNNELKKMYPNLPGAFEGNAVDAPDGSIVNFIRYTENKAVLLKTDPKSPNELPRFYKLIDFPMGHTKFEIQKHKNGFYYAVGNRLPLRNILSLYKSKDLENWEFVKDILNYENMDKDYIAFQYPAFIFDDDEIIILSRTAFNGAYDFHNNNYLTVHKTSLI